MKILFVEDEIWTSKPLVDHLTEFLHHQVIQVSTVSEAINCINEVKFDIIILDVLLPFSEVKKAKYSKIHNNGLDLVLHLHDVLKYSIPIIILSATSELNINISKYPNVIARLVKPCLPMDLISLISQLDP